MRSIATMLAWISLIAASPADSQSWSPQPWLTDLAQAKQAFATKYANLDWLEHDREVTLASLFDEAADHLQSARSDEEAKTIMNRLINRVGDGHVSIDWPRIAAWQRTPAAVSTTRYDACANLAFDENRNTPGIGASLSGYHAVGEPGPFPAGIIHFHRRTVGIIRISRFEPQESPAICRAAFQALHGSIDGPCDDQCQDALLTWSYNRITRALEEQVRALQAAGATILLVDVTGNEGGSEWAEAAARIVSPKPLTSEALGFVRGPHWVEQWTSLASQLRTAAASADAQDRQRLLDWAAKAEQSRERAAQQCSPGQARSLVAQSGYATGLVGTAHAGEFAGKAWADLVFNIAQFPYHDSVWAGPLAVLVDDQTWSAAEQFAAVLQDNRAAVIVGARTGGAGCGLTNGGAPTVLNNSGATLELPDCARFRKDGSNEVAGIIPDVLTGMRHNDGSSFKAKLVEAHLLETINLATNLRAR